MPGLSGSIFAIILGLYEQGLDAIANFRKEPVKHFKFLLPIAIGGGVGVLASARAILFITAQFPVPSYMFFSGLVIGSWPLISRKTAGRDSFKPVYLLGSVLAIAFMMFMSRLGGAGDGDHIALYRIYDIGDFFMMVFAGLFSMSMMAIPGVSGSIMVIILGHYGTVYNAISESVELLRHILTLNVAAAIESMYTVFILVPFALGSLLGIIYISKIMLFFLQKAEQLVYYCVGGALIGTVYILLNMGVLNNLPSGDDVSDVIVFIVTALVSLFVGIFCTVFLDKKEV